MASFRKCTAQKGVRWQAIVRTDGHSLTKTFARADAAKAWAAKVESAIANATKAQPFNRSDWLREGAAQRDARTEALLTKDELPDPQAEWTLGRACRHYREKVTPSKKGERQETLRLLAWERHPYSTKRLGELTTDDIQKHVADRVLAGKSGSTVAKEVLLLSAVYKCAQKSWKLDVGNPARGVDLPAAARGRQRRLEDGHGDEQGEEDRMRAALLEASRGQDMVDLMDMAVETGMRLGEILSLRRGQIRRIKGAHIVEQPDSKNGHPRIVTLSPRAVEVLERRCEKLQHKDAKVFQLNYDQVEGRWSRARRKREWLASVFTIYVTKP